MATKRKPPYIEEIGGDYDQKKLKVPFATTPLNVIALHDAIRKEWPNCHGTVEAFSAEGKGTWQCNMLVTEYTTPQQVVEYIRETIRGAQGSLCVERIDAMLNLPHMVYYNYYMSSSSSASAPAPAPAPVPPLQVQAAAVVVPPAVEPKEKERIFVAFDIEKAGNLLKEHPMLAVGICVGSLQQGVISKLTLCCKPEPHQQVELRSMYEFWCKYPDVLKRIDQDSKPLSTQMKALGQFLLELDRKYPDDKYQIIILSDNPAFDLTNLDYNFCTHTGQLPVRYSRAGKYRAVADPSERFEILRLWTLQEELLRNIVSHDHWPENDAEQIFWQHVVATAIQGMLHNHPQTMTIEKITAELFRLFRPDSPDITKEMLLAYAREDKVAIA